MGAKALTRDTGERGSVESLRQRIKPPVLVEDLASGQDHDERDRTDPQHPIGELRACRPSGAPGRTTHPSGTQGPQRTEAGYAASSPFGVVPATRKVLEKTGLTLQDFDVIELNEAFAAQVLACDRELKLDHDRLNPNGGAIALGHPIGMTGARIVLTCAYEMREKGYSLGLATLCISGGMGMAIVLER